MKTNLKLKKFFKEKFMQVVEEYFGLIKFFFSSPDNTYD